MNRILRVFQYLSVLAVFAGGVQAAFAQEEESKKHHEIRYEMTFRTTPPAEQRCKSSLEQEYRQKDTVAAVVSTIGNPDCGASSGSYTALVRFRDENNELQSLEYPETWQREDDLPIETHREYFIGHNVDLISVRSRKMRCICANSGEVEETPEE